jgi:hypothetical protein
VCERKEGQTSTRRATKGTHIGIVNAELLKAVHVKGFESVDVEHANERRDFAVRLNGGVDARDQPVEQAAVEQHGQRISFSQGRKQTNKHSQRKIDE